MSVIAEYAVSASNPSTVGGTSGVLQYFSSNPSQNLWNSGATGVNTSATPNNLGSVPSSTNATGQLNMPSLGRLNGNRFSIYATGSAVASASTPTITPIIQIQTATFPTAATAASYSTIAGNVASNATVANKIVSWSMEAKLVYDAGAGVIGGFMNYQFYNQTGGGTNSDATDAIITAVTGLTQNGPNGGPGFGFVVGITFSAGTTGNSASLYEFKIVQF